MMLSKLGFKTGFYFVMFNGHWTIGHLSTALTESWRIFDEDKLLKSSELQCIGPRLSVDPNSLRCVKYGEVTLAVPTAEYDLRVREAEALTASQLGERQAVRCIVHDWDIKGRCCTRCGMLYKDWVFQEGGS